jgi:tetratricopeptide (TPR) repeat protein
VRGRHIHLFRRATGDILTGGLFRPAARWVAAAAVMLAPVALSHPDLLAQIERMDERVTAEPDNPEWLLRRGDLYRRHQEYRAAARDFAAARALAPEHPQLDLYRGRLALETGDPVAAGGYLDGYLYSHPLHPIGWRLRAEAWLAQEDFPAAAGAFERAVRFSEKPSPALYRQWVLALLAANEAAAVLAAVDQGLEQLGAEVSLLGLGADVALVQLQHALAKTYLGRLPPGLADRSPWRERMREAECVADRKKIGADDTGACIVGARRRLAAHLGP